MQYRIKLNDVNPSNIWFTSDWHLFHNNILKYDGRPFKNIDDMNDTIIKNHSPPNLGPKDHLFILGDLSFRDRDNLNELLHRITAKKYFVVGNHDKPVWKQKFMDRHFSRYFAGYAELTVKQQMAVLSHYPFFTWNRSHKGSWHLFGHTHGQDASNPRLKTHQTMNVGVMLNDYKPFNWNDIADRFKDRKATDDHN